MIIIHKKARRSQPLIFSLILAALIFSVSNAAVAVKVFSRDEGLTEGNISRPRIYVQNTGTETINNFSYRYFFTTENSLAPMVEPYYLTDKEQIMLVPYGSGYYIQYTVTNANLGPGGLMPQSSGNCVGLHYNDWSAWTKTNDFSNNLSSSFAENQNISVYVAGARIYGNEPEGGSGGGSGSVLREFWRGIAGTSTDAIPINTAPYSSGQISSLDEPVNCADSFGTRIRGYITAPSSGGYTFWIASDDYSKLYLSTNADTANKVLIASVAGYTNYKEWNKYTSQKSAVKALVAGTKYFIEILHKDGTQNDNCSVGWLKPGQSGSVPSEVVPSSVLTTYVPPVAPATPTSLTATAVSSSRIDLSWVDVSNECGYSIQMKCGSGAFTDLAIVSANQTSYQVTGLIAETNYMFKICAYNTFGSSAYGNTAQATTFAAAGGGATRELWMSCAGTDVASIPVNTTPYNIITIDSLECTQQTADFFGRRIRGYIIPPATGSYTFWIASDDNSQLWLSTNDQASSKVLIASVSGTGGYTAYREWNKFTSQKSSAKTLTAGVRYYFEVLHKEGNQYDNLSVGWLKPGQSGSVPSQIVPKSALAPFIIPSIPAAPSGLTATALSATQIDLTWTDNSNNENGFRIVRATGGGSFVEIGTAYPNSGIYHDAGLSATTQYQYKICAFNDLGNSSYSTTASAITLAPGEITPPAPIGLTSFAIYSTEKTKLGARCRFFGDGGAVGSNKEVEILQNDTINGNVVSGGTISLLDRVLVNGGAIAAGIISINSSSSVTGNVRQYATVPTLTIPALSSITTSGNAVVVDLDQSLTLPPGYYDTLTVKDRGTLTLSAGLYTCKKLFFGPNVKVKLDVSSSEMIEVQVKGDVEFSDRCTVSFIDEGYVPFVRFYTNSPNVVRIGCDVLINGMVIAPYGHIWMYSRSRCNGALYGKYVTVEPDGDFKSDDIIGNCEDSDGDRVANVLEAVMTTNPNDSMDHVEIAVPSDACIDNTQAVSISYNYGVFFKDYAFATDMAAAFPATSLIHSFIPLIITVNNTPNAGIPAFSKSGYGVQGRYINFRPENGLKSGRSCTLQLPRITSASTTTYVPYQWDAMAGDWLPIDTSKIISSDANSVTIELQTLKPIVFAGQMKDGGKTLYFDGGYVYSNKASAVFRYDIAIPKYSADVESVTIRVDYRDYTSNPSGDSATYKVKCDKKTGVSHIGTLFSKGGQFVCAGGMKILRTKLIFKKADASTYECSYECLDNFMVRSGQSLMWYSHNNAADYAGGSPEDLMQLTFNPSTESFESANFGDGRIIFNTTPGGTSPFSWEYYLTDHLGSTRMVINDQGTVTEATNYQPYGTMTPIATSTSAIPVREKFTTKEFDTEGGSDSADDGMNLYYFGARYYDPEVGVWTARDPVDQYWNSYAYTGGNPVNLVDQYGLAAGGGGNGGDANTAAAKAMNDAFNSALANTNLMANSPSIDAHAPAPNAPATAPSNANATQGHSTASTAASNSPSTAASTASTGSPSAAGVGNGVGGQGSGSGAGQGSGSGNGNAGHGFGEGSGEGGGSGPANSGEAEGPGSGNGPWGGGNGGGLGPTEPGNPGLMSGNESTEKDPYQDMALDPIKNRLPGYWVTLYGYTIVKMIDQVSVAFPVPPIFSGLKVFRGAKEGEGLYKFILQKYGLKGPLAEKFKVAVHKFKLMSGRGGANNLTKEQLEEIAKEIINK
jgi:RHS repeat-associated protein